MAGDSGVGVRLARALSRTALDLASRSHKNRTEKAEGMAGSSPQAGEVIRALFEALRTGAGCFPRNHEPGLSGELGTRQNGPFHGNEMWLPENDTMIILVIRGRNDSQGTCSKNGRVLASPPLSTGGAHDRFGTSGSLIGKIRCWRFSLQRTNARETKCLVRKSMR